MARCLISYLLTCQGLRLADGIDLLALRAEYGVFAVLPAGSRASPSLLLMALVLSSRPERISCTQALSSRTRSSARSVSTSPSSSPSAKRLRCAREIGGLLCRSHERDRLPAADHRWPTSLTPANELQAAASPAASPASSSARLTDPDGFLVSNEVISTLFAALPPRATWQNGTRLPQ